MYSGSAVGTSFPEEGGKMGNSMESLTFPFTTTA